jgi:hemoglobin/transferrin/lactoferrin receptor protein
VDDPTVSGSDPATPGNVISVDDSWRSFAASVRALRPVAPGWGLFGGLSQGFRAPNLSDLTRLDDTSGVETPSPDLDEETFLQAELGLKAREACWSGQIAFWHTWIDDLIVPSPTGRLIGSTPEVRKDNVGDGWVQGVDAEVSVRVLDEWTLAGAATWQRGRVDQIGTDGRVVRRPLSRLMPLTFAATATYEMPGAGWRAWVSGRFADRQDDLSLKDETDSERIPPGGTPGYGVVSLGMSVDVADGATLALAVENVFDTEYRVHGSGVNEPGRSLVLSLDLRF